MSKKPWMLITVREREIMTEQFETYEDARETMLQELKYEFNRGYNEEDWDAVIKNNSTCIFDDFGFDKWSAWSNIDDNWNHDWAIVGID